MQYTPFPRRLALSEKVLKTYPDSVPVIVSYDNREKKFICNRDYVMSFIYSNIKKSMMISPDLGILFMVRLLGRSYLVPGSQIAGDVYDKYKDPDGLLYLTCQTESVFGNL